VSSAEPQPTRAPAVFLDRDGVIVELVPDPDSGRHESPYRPEDVQLAAGSIEGLLALREAGYRLVAASNQPAAAKGTATLEELQQVHARAVELLRDGGIELDGWRYCFHHPDGVVPGLAAGCDCRKPGPGLLLEAARDLDLELTESWMIGDAATDMEAGQRAGCRTVLVENPRSGHRRPADGCAPDLRARSLAEAGAMIASRATSPRPAQ
jgi:D-glycero-D-manno-heptose 1,7-bisphosphate phosphatase